MVCNSYTHHLIYSCMFYIYHILSYSCNDKEVEMSTCNSMFTMVQRKCIQSKLKKQKCYDFQLLFENSIAFE